MLNTYDRCRLTGHFFTTAKHSPSDNAQGPLGSHEQLLKVVPGVVFNHLIHGADNRAIDKYSFETQYHVACHTITNDTITARIR